ncbi:hypothetical protein MESS2_1430007 [Mesorhizobium metallidurans STM 2683]|uniref:IstB-like ATP-binding domain-containing protein n=1 Tax=Mesorhizobium metallidurans STM 2683 TaxID=1297569 RepID=M5EL21_9HYPH|nr:hypothetical protein MESS2_1430007 [Mesorhizobium metallidurans STM 2683]
MSKTSTLPRPGSTRPLVQDLARGDFLAHERNVVLIGGTGTGKTHLAGTHGRLSRAQRLRRAR